jgi:hypothetical protein
MIPVAALAIFAHDGLGKLGEEYAISYAFGRRLLRRSALGFKPSPRAKAIV